MAISVFSVSLTSGQTQPDSAVDLGEFGWQKIAVEIPSSPSGSFQFYVSSTETGTFRPTLDPAGTSTSPVGVFSVDSAVVANGAVAHVPAGFRFVKPRNTSGVTDTVTTFKIICSN